MCEDEDVLNIKPIPQNRQRLTCQIIERERFKGDDAIIRPSQSISDDNIEDVEDVETDSINIKPSLRRRQQLTLKIIKREYL